VWVYRNIDQRVVDGAVNASGMVPPRPAAPCSPSSPARSTSTARCCSVPQPSVRDRARHRQRVRGRSIRSWKPQNDTWLLTVGTFLPLVGVLVMLFIPKRRGTAHKSVALVTAGATLVVGIITLTRFDYDQAEKLQFFVDAEWIEVIRSNYTIGLDGISLPLYFLSMVITFLVMVYTWDHMPEPGNPKAFLILMLVLQTGMAGTFIAQDLILFFVFFEVVLLPMYFMIGVWGGEQRQYASLKFFLYTMFGSALMLVAFLAIFFQTDAESFGFAHLVDAGALIDRTSRSGSSPACSSASP
jgi:NADH-quinone oxidoreductase subunit M